MVTRIELKRITEAGLASYKAAVDSTKKTTRVFAEVFDADKGETVSQDTGEVVPNPNYELAGRRYEAAKYHYDTTKRIAEKALSLKFKQNQYDGKCATTGTPVKAFAGFVRQENGRWVTYSWDTVISQLGITIDGLPKIED